MAAEDSEEKETCTKGRSTVSNEERGGGGWAKITPARSHCYLCKTPFALRLSSSGQSQAKCVIWASCWHFVLVGERERERERWRTLYCEVLSFDSLSRKHLSVFRNLMSRASESKQKEAISTLVSGKDLPAVLPTVFFEKGWYFRCWYLGKKLCRETFERSCCLSASAYRL